MLEHFASLFGLSQEDVLSVQLDEQTDSKVGENKLVTFCYLFLLL